MFIDVQPVLGCRDIDQAVDYYVDRLGFSLVFKLSGQPGYVVIRRDNVELHLQWREEVNLGGADPPMYRFLVADVNLLFKEFEGKDVFHNGTALRETPWATREFAFYDLDRNGLIFCMNV